MLSSLTIQDFVIVDKLELNFKGGMSVLSGETGAGKSILIDALSLCLGARAEAGMVREGCERANVIAVFESSAQAEAILKEQAIDPEDELHLRRSIDSKGKSKAFVNGVSVPASTLKALAEVLVDIHGQHAFQTLAKPSEQMKMLDEFAKHSSLLEAVGSSYLALKVAESAFADAQTGQQEKQAIMENLTWRLETLSEFNPANGQWEELVTRHERLSHGAELIEGAQQALDEISQQDHALLDQVNHLIERLSRLSHADPSLNVIVKNLSESEILMREASYELSNYLKTADLDPELLEEAERQLSQWHDAARKLKVLPETLPEEMEGIRKQLDHLSGDLDLDALHAKVLQCRKAYDSAAKELTVSRGNAARELARRVTESMQTLNMQGGQFDISFSSCEPSRTGSEMVDFLVAGHPGVKLQSVSKVASGGELARISLAITVNTVESTHVPTLIFDEVDSGIGGAVAETVGKYLRRLATSKQVLCVTHLPQVAAQGNHHYQVSKEIEGNFTRSTIRMLGEEARVLEVARMLGGISISEATKQAARELISSVD